MSCSNNVPEGQETAPSTSNEPVRNKYLLHSENPVPYNNQKRFRMSLNFSSNQSQYSASDYVLEERIEKPKSNLKEKSKFPNGNFSNYYTCRNKGLECDPRLEFLDKVLFVGKRVLDVGCNSGFVTTYIARHYEPEEITGIDLDPILIDKAWSHLKFEASLLDPNSESKETYFPISMPLLFGSIPLHDAPGFPSNVNFECVNVTSKEACADLLGKIDVVLVLSITKWIHLNGGDEAIKRFFRLIGRILAPGGKLILEPQPWDSYHRRNAVSETTQYYFQRIKFKPEKFDKFLTENIGLELLTSTVTPDAEVKSGKLANGAGFKRPIFIYQKPMTVKQS